MRERRALRQFTLSTRSLLDGVQLAETLGIALFFSLLKRVIISITVLLVTRILLNCNWGFSLEAAFFAPFLTDLLDFLYGEISSFPRRRKWCQLVEATAYRSQFASAARSGTCPPL